MSWKDLDKSTSSNGRFVTWSGEGSKRFRILDEEPHTVYVHKISQKVGNEEVFRSIPATPTLDENYIQQQNGNRYPAEALFNIRCLEYDKDDSGKKDIDSGTIRVLQGGPRIFRQLRTIYEQEGHLNGFDVVITKKGEKRDTEYTVSAAPRSFDVDVKALTEEMNEDPELLWENIFRPVTAEDQKRMLKEAGFDVNYDPAAELMETMTYAEAREVKLTFGKYKDQKLKDVLVMDPNYVAWAAEKVKSNDEVAAACRILVNGSADNELKAADEPKSLPKSKTTDKKAPPKTEPKKSIDISDERKSEMKREIEDAVEDMDPIDFVNKIKQHGNGKARIKDLTDAQLMALHEDVTS